MSYLLKIPANIYLYLKISALLAYIKIRIVKFNTIAYLCVFVQLDNSKEQKPTIRELETQHKQKRLFLLFL